MKLFKILGLFLLGTLIMACGDDDEKSTMQSIMQMTVGDEALELEKSYTINNTAVKFSTAAMYIGNVEFDVAGQTYKNEDDYFLLKPGTLTFNLGEVTGASLDGVKFNIGLDAETNGLDEEDYNSRPAGDPLGVQDPSMHWSWNAGYRFIRLDGKADLDADGEYETSLTYHLGTNNFYATVDKSMSLDIEPGSNTYNIHIDIAKVLGGLNFNNESDQVTHTANNMPLATTVFNNLPSAVTVEK